MPHPAVDGRRLRADRSRAAVVDALLALYREGVTQPGAHQIAARAGVSERSVFRHFDDLEALAEAAIDAAIGDLAPLYATPLTEGTLERRASALAAQRVKLFESIGPIARAATFVSSSSPTVANAIAFRRDLLRQQIVIVFAPELEYRSPTQQADVVDAIDMLCSIEALELLASTKRFRAARTRRILASSIAALLHQEGTTP